MAALSIGVITSYVSITEGKAGEFLRGVGKFTKDVTDAAVSQVGEWQELGQNLIFNFSLVLSRQPVWVFQYYNYF